ncbi:phosphonate ABC transporter, permease protein PhnE [Candidatus Bipolaricaulota bacterium]|nr:phosphonate ABC transporter, permease protein PhnE [Candidatus Bipolaricaulota bacterium]
MQDRYHAELMMDEPDFRKRFQSIRRRALVLLTDVIALSYLWTLASYCWNRFVLGTGSYITLPWWAMIIIAIEIAAVWENFGVSLGMHLLGVRLSSRSEESNPANHALRYLLWHIAPLSLISFFFSSKEEPWHDRVTHLYAVSAAEVEEKRVSWYRTSWKNALALIGVLTVLTAVGVTDMDLYALFTRASRTGRIWTRLLNPNFSLLGSGFRLLIVTIYMAFMATIFAIVVAVPLSFFAARNLAQGIIGRAIYTVVRVAISITRSIDAIIWAIIFLVWVRVGAFPGVLALFVHSIADLTKLYSERLESIDPGPVEAIRAAGGNKLQVILYGIIPQIINPYLSFTLYRWDINVRMATIIGIVGGGGIGQSLYQYMKVSDYSSAGMMMLLIVVTVWSIDYISARLRARLN